MRARRTYTLSSGKHSLALVAVLLITLAATAGWAQQDPVARVLKSVGDVKVRHLADAGFDTDVRATMPLVSGDALRVGDGSFVSLLFIDDKTLIKIKPNSEFQIVETRNTRSIMLDYGTLRSLLPQPIKDFRVETPVSVASVKGTDFWLIHDATAGIDRAYGVEGIVEILNVISGLTQNLTVNTMIISTAAGQLSPPIPISPDEMPSDPDELQEGPPEPEAEPEGEPQEGEAAPETGEAVDPAAPAVGAAAAAPPPDAPAEEEAAEEPEQAQRSGTGVGLGLGSVTIDGDVFYQIALRPEFAFGKVGIGLDLVVYMDAEGKFRKDEWEWDDPSDYLDKLYYLRYATEQDPFFLRIGAMPSVQYGFGALMSGYSNVTEYPQVRRVGFEIGGRIKENFTLKGFTANLKEMGEMNGLVGVRGTYRVAKAFPLTIGVNFVTDLNQYGGLKDKDGDGRPDLVDDFPDDVVVVRGVFAHADVLVELALESHQRLLHPGHVHRGAGHGGQAGFDELVDVRSIIPAGDVHLCGDGLGDHVHDELGMFQDVAAGVLHPIGPVVGGEGQGRGVGADAVEKRERGQVGLAGRAARGDPSDRAGHHAANQVLVQITGFLVLGVKFRHAKIPC